ncbi:N-acetylmuramoyl-L-alanine amidase family protein [Winogradskyella sp. PE311]|uniref:N-acetylmuramoyl-L-alanine amidase family protein n=1 Tax=Winogradskyella sp. PE311 TaxID=3366943 RepID=UPI00397EDABD
MLKHLLYFFTLCTITVALGQTTNQSVVAQKGDGIFSLLRAHDIPYRYIDSFIQLNKEKITSGNQLIIGKSYVLPIIKSDSVTASINRKIDSTSIKPEIKTELLFGEDYKNFTVKNDTLKNAVYYLIAGHGGPDPGAVTTYNSKLITEDEYAYDVTLRLARKLMAKGATVYIIIKDKNDGIRDQRILEVDYDEVCYPKKEIPRSQKLRLQQRTKAVNKLYLKHKGAYQRLIVTHVDSRSVGKNIDVFFYHHKNSKNGKRLADHVHTTFKEKYAKHQPNRIYSGTVTSRSGLYLVKNTLPPMVYIELGNIRNSKDQKRILNYDNREALANWIHLGLLADYSGRK